METVALYDYEKQEDDELSLKEGDVITDVEQVCAVSELCLKTMEHMQNAAKLMYKKTCSLCVYFKYTLVLTSVYNTFCLLP